MQVVAAQYGLLHLELQYLKIFNIDIFFNTGEKLLISRRCVYITEVVCPTTQIDKSSYLSAESVKKYYSRTSVARTLMGLLPWLF